MPPTAAAVGEPLQSLGRNGDWEAAGAELRSAVSLRPGGPARGTTPRRQVGLQGLGL